MKKILTSFFIFGLNILLAISQTDSVFWFATPYATSLHDGPCTVDITLTNTDINDQANVRIEFPNNSLIATKYVTINPQQTANITLTTTEIANLTTNNYNAVENSAILVRSDRMITAYYEYHRSDNNPDIFALKGSNALGQEFWVPFQTRWPNHSQASWSTDPAFSQINIVATENGTSITITLPAGKAAVGIPAGGSKTITLNRGETFMIVPELSGGIPNVSASAHLGGTHIVSNDPDKPIAVTIGDDSVQKSSAYDYIGDQLIPLINAKGKPLVGQEYIVMRGEVSQIDATNSEAVFILGTKNATTITLTRSTGAVETYPVSAGQQQVIYMPTNQPYARIQSNYPVYVLHVSGFGHEMGGAVLPKVEGCTGSLSVSFVRSKSQSFYLNLMVKSDAIDSVFMDDGGGNNYHIQNDFFAKVPNSDWHILKDSAAVNTFFQSRIITGNVTRVYNTVNVFHLGVINGVTSGGGCIYGYFSDYNELESEVGIGGQGNVFQGCDVDSVRLHSSGGIRYLWSPKSNVDDYTVAEPMSYPPKGLFTFSVKVSRPCFDDTIMYVTTYLPESPYSYFATDVDRGCSPLKINLQNGSEETVYHLVDWGDGSPYYISNSFDTVSHVYVNNTDTVQEFIVRMNVSNIFGCNSVYRDTVIVYPGINGNIALMDPTDNIGCHPLQVEFDNLSSGNTDRWEWDFGDGANSFDSIPIHIFTNFGKDDTTYHIDFKAISPFPYNCESTDALDVTVHPYLNVNFGADTITRCSPFKININNSSTRVDNYYLNFGDGNDTTFNSFSYVYHTYTNLDTIKRIDTLLLIGNNFEGCYDTAFKEITIYPEIKAQFSISTDEVCDSVWVNFTDLSYGHDFDYLYEFGDGNSTVLPNTGHLYRNTTDHDTSYIIKLRIESPYCSNYAYDTINVHNIVNAGFAYSVVEECTPVIIKIDPGNTKGDSLIWDFDGDNITDSIILNHNIFYKTFYNNNVSGDISQDIKLTASNYGCSDSLKRPINIRPQVVAAIDNVSSTNDCSPLTVSFGNLSKGGDLNYYWEFNDATSESDSIPPDHTFVNNTKDDKTFRVKLTAIHPLSNCASQDSVDITVYPYVNAGFTMENSEVCTPFNVTFTNTSTKITNESYQWNITDGYSSSATDFIHEFNNTSTDSIKKYYISLDAFNNLQPQCNSSYEDSILVYPQVLASFTPDNLTSCDPDTVNFSQNSRGYALKYKWTFDDGTNSSVLNPVHIFTNVTKDERIFNVKLQVSDTNNCVDDTTIQITVDPHIDAGFTFTISDKCTPMEVSFINNSTKATNEIYQWNFFDGSPVSNLTDITYTFNDPALTAPEYKKVQLRALLLTNPLCEAYALDSVLVYPEAIASFTPDGTVGCNPFKVEFTENSNGYGLDYFWDFADGTTSVDANPSRIFENYLTTDKTYPVKLTVKDDQDCVDDTIINIVTHPFVKTEFSYVKTSECTPINVTFNPGNSKSNTFAWDYDGNGLNDEIRNNKTSFNHTYNNSLPNSEITIYPRLISYYDFAPACSDTLIDTISVPPVVIASFTPDNFAGCQPFKVLFNNSSTGGILDYNWDFGDTTSSSELDPDHTFYNYTSTDKTIPVKLTIQAQNSCKDDTIINITAYSYIESDFKIEEAAKCSPFTVYVDNSSRGGITNYEWNFGDGSPIVNEEDPTHTYINISGLVEQLNIKLDVSNIHGCSHSYQQIVTVYPQVNPAFDVVPEGCHPYTAQFTNSSLYARDFKWTFGDGSSSAQQNPQHLFNDFDRNLDSTYLVTLTAHSMYECVSSKDTIITVHPKPLALFEVSISLGCPPFNVDFINRSDGESLTYNWSFGDGFTSTAENASHSFDNDLQEIKEYDVILISTTNNGCTNSHSKQITVYPKVIAKYSADVKTGCSPLTVNFTNLSEKFDYVEYDFDNGLFSTIDDPEHRFVNNNNTDRKFAVELTSKSDYNCYAKFVDTITVYPSPSVEFSVEPTHQVYIPEPKVEIINWSNHTDTWNFSWDFGNGTTSNSSEKQFSKEYTGTWGKPDNDYEISIVLTAVNGSHPECTASKTHNIRIIPPVPEIEISGEEPKGCEPFTVNFSTFNNYVDEFKWDFDDGGSTSNEVAPVHEFTKPGAYNVKLEVIGDGGKNFDYKTVIVYPKPEVNFVVQPDLVMLAAMDEDPEEVKFFNQTELGKTYLWDFGDGTFSTEEEPTHVYDDAFKKELNFPIDVNVTLKAWSEYGCVDSVTQEAAVTVDAAGVVKFPNAFTPNPDGPNGGSYNDLENIVFHPFNEGVEEYHLEIYTRWGEAIFTSDDVAKGWDGYYKGKLVNQGVYIWKVWGRYTNNKEFVKYGDVTVLHPNPDNNN